MPRSDARDEVTSCRSSTPRSPSSTAVNLLPGTPPPSPSCSGTSSTALSSHPGQDRGHRAGRPLPRGRGPPADRGSARRRQDHDGEGARRVDRHHVRPHPVHTGPAALRRGGRDRVRCAGPPSSCSGQSVFANIVLADEINRASPKTQSALLEAMAEGQVTIDGRTHTLNRPFVVIATQNPSSTRAPIRCPTASSTASSCASRWATRPARTRSPSSARETDGLEKLAAVVGTGRVMAMANAVRGVHVAPAIKEYLVDVAGATRRHPYVWVGMSPRATLALQRVARARAAAAGRTYVSPDDLKALALPVLAHRLQLTPDAAAAGTSRPSASCRTSSPRCRCRSRPAGEVAPAGATVVTRNGWLTGAGAVGLVLWAGSPAASSCSCWGRRGHAPGGRRAAHGLARLDLRVSRHVEPPRVHAGSPARSSCGCATTAAAPRPCCGCARGDRDGGHGAGQPAPSGGSGGLRTSCPRAGGGCCGSGRSTSWWATPSG